MPYRTNVRRATNRVLKKQARRRYKPRKSQSLAVQALKGVAQLKAQIGQPEVKHVDAFYAATATYAGTLTSMISGMAQGTGDSDNRIGDIIHCKNLRINGTVQINNDATQPQFVRIVIYIDKAGKNYTNWSDIYTLSGTANASRAMKAYDQRFDTKTIFDTLLSFSPNGQEAQVFNLNIPLNHQVVFNAGSSTVINRGDVVIGIVSDDVTSGPVMKFNARLFYTDN